MGHVLEFVILKLLTEIAKSRWLHQTFKEEITYKK
jgi:hypothetical protein